MGRKTLTLDSFFPKRLVQTRKRTRQPNEAKARSLYRMQSFVSGGGKPRTSHPWFSVAGGLLGSTSASVRTRVKLGERLSYGDRRDLEEQLKKLGYEEKYHSRMGGSWSGTFYERTDYETLKGIEKVEREKIRQNWLSFHRERFEPFVKIALEYGEY